MGVRWAGTTSPSLIQHPYPTNKGFSSNLGNLGGLQKSLEVLLWQKGNHKEEVDLRDRGVGSLVILMGHM